MAFESCLCFGIALASVFATSSVHVVAVEDLAQHDGYIDLEQNIQERGLKKFVLDGVDLMKLNKNDLHRFVDAEDRIFFGKLGRYIFWFIFGIQSNIIKDN